MHGRLLIQMLKRRAIVMVVQARQAPWQQIAWLLIVYSIEALDSGLLPPHVAPHVGGSDLAVFPYP